MLDQCYFFGRQVDHHCCPDNLLFSSGDRHLETHIDSLTTVFRCLIRSLSWCCRTPETIKEHTPWSPESLFTFLYSQSRLRC